MDLDWDTDCYDSSKIHKFNDSVITYDKNSSKESSGNAVPLTEIRDKEMSLENSLTIDTNVKNPKELLHILNYLSFVSNKLRGLIRNKNSINKNQKDTVDIDSKDNIDYENLMLYLEWLHNTTDKIKGFFICKNKKDIGVDTNFNANKLFKTSSYKFCNFKDSCKVHKNKNKICEKNHFVFDMLIVDIQKLIESINIISKEDNSNLFWIINDNIIIYNKNNGIIEKHNYYNANNTNENQMYIDKNIIFKCFDVISFIFNKMYEEAYLFLNYDTPSELINI